MTWCPTMEQLDMIAECRKTHGILAARQLMEKLGFPIPPAELITPVAELEALNRKWDEEERY